MSYEICEFKTKPIFTDWIDYALRGKVKCSWEKTFDDLYVIVYELKPLKGQENAN